MTQRTYKVRGGGVNKAGRPRAYRLTVPPDVADAIPEGTEFTVEMTEDGLLYRPAERQPERQLPSWARRKR